MTQSPLTEPKKLWNIPYILVLTVSTLSSFSFYMVATILSKYLVRLGASITFAGFVVGLFPSRASCAARSAASWLTG